MHEKSKYTEEKQGDVEYWDSDESHYYIATAAAVRVNHWFVAQAARLWSMESDNHQFA